MYSTPGISQSSFSIGRVARSSTSLALKPGMATITSTIGTLICGSSSRGSMTTAAAPSSTEAMTTSGVSLESMNAAGLIDLRLDFLDVEAGEQLAALHAGAGRGGVFQDAATDLGLDHGALLGAHGADHLLHCLGLHGDGR
jgi:hypothetical protein